MPSISSVLIANRGEIAVRIIRACREMGLRTIAVYSEADRAALHVRLAEEAVLLGPPPPQASYLSIDRLLAAAHTTGADAVHPGYGFLAENAAFAQAVGEAGLTFIGPPPGAIRAMGNKAEARARIQSSGAQVPIIPGYHGPDDDDSLARAAHSLGYPILVKAAAGGGGKAMRVLGDPSDLLAQVAAARREAAGAFGDPHLLLERYIAGARHIEFQVLADTHGNCVHLFERECSIQRRYQKLVEETPSPLLDDALRARMGEAAVAAARAVGYINAGTVEFIVDPATREFYFLEMNTRLQVEHPVTELTTGLDLVQLQIRIAAGEPLPFAQSDLQSRGHAVECRINAEDPANSFLPSTGRLLLVREPRGPGIRVDSGVETGDEVTLYYDPLLAKLLVYASDRPSAIARMQAALSSFVLLGVSTNLAFQQAVLAHPEFQAGRAAADFIPRFMAAWQPEPGRIPPPALIAAAIDEFENAVAARAAPSSAPHDPYSPWAQDAGFRMGADRSGGGSP